MNLLAQEFGVKKSGTRICVLIQHSLGSLETIIIAEKLECESLYSSTSATPPLAVVFNEL